MLTVIALATVVLAAWKLIDLLRMGARAVGIGARAFARGMRSMGRGLLSPFRMFGAWRRRKAIAVARVADHRDRGMLREQSATIAMLAAQNAELMDALATFTERRARAADEVAARRGEIN